jgi:hypothetical protein
MHDRIPFARALDNESDSIGGTGFEGIAEDNRGIGPGGCKQWEYTCRGTTDGEETVSVDCIGAGEEHGLLRGEE